MAEISAMVLRELRRRAEDALGESAERAVITVPANFNELQRSATKAAGKVAGLDVLRILNEPTAAALAYGYTAGESERVAVYDLGGGTFDITILELEDDVFEVLSTAGDTFLGGEDLDRALAEVMCDRFSDEHGIDLRRDPQAFERVKAAAEWAKCRLSDEEEIELTVEEIARAGGRVLDLAFAMTRAELEALATPWLDRSFAVCTKALASAGLRVHEIDRVVLVGGSTRMPLCRRRVAEFFGKAPRTDLDPDLVVAQGAAIHGFALGGPREPRPLRTAPVRPRIAGRPTRVGVPRQPAFAPEAQGILVPRPARRPARSTRPPPPMPELPPPARSSGAVLVTRAVEVRTPKSTIDAVLDELVPPDGDDSSALDELVPPDDETRALDELVPPDEHAAGALDDLAPPDDGGAGVLEDLAPPDDGGAGALELALSESAALGGDDLDDRDHLALSNDLDALAPPAELDDLAPAPFAPAGTPFGLAPDDPFAPPDPGARAPRAPEPELSSPPRPARPRGQKRVPSREPTAKLSIDLRPPARPHPPVPAAKRPPPPPPPPAPPARPPRPRPAPPAPP
ncbi:MAG TPA: Hsp70 family protein, partial [Sandaracinaceae bacterium]